MRFHWGSFLLGYGAGLSSAYLAKQFRPVLLEIATAVYQLIDSAAANVAQKREDVEDILAEARARARGGSEARRQPWNGEPGREGADLERRHGPRETEQAP